MCIHPSLVRTRTEYLLSCTVPALAILDSRFVSVLFGQIRTAPNQKIPILQICDCKMVLDSVTPLNKSSLHATSKRSPRYFFLNFTLKKEWKTVQNCIRVYVVQRDYFGMDNKSSRTDSIDLINEDLKCKAIRWY